MLYQIERDLFAWSVYCFLNLIFTKHISGGEDQGRVTERCAKVESSRRLRIGVLAAHAAVRVRVGVAAMEAK
jgi:hypothetical protein